MQRKVTPLRSNQSDGVGAAPNPALAKTAITAQERIIPRSTPKETTTTWTPAAEQDEPADGEHSMEPLSDHGDAEGKANQPVSGEENSPDDDAHIIPKRHLEQENLHRRLTATARSLKKQKQRLKAAQDTLNRRWTKC